MNLNEKIIFFISLFFFPQVYSQSYQETIIRVVDWDTYFFQTSEGSIKVRMDGIDAPEISQEYSPESKTFMEGYLHKKATLEYNGTDKYGRMLGTLFIDGKNLNLESVKSGKHSFWYTMLYTMPVTLAVRIRYKGKIQYK